jgi:predicted transcriptional regulator
MSQQLKLTPVEWEIMESVWKLGHRVSARDVVRQSFPNGEKAYTTVQTILNTLHKKGLLEREKIGMVNFYTPTRSRSQMAKLELDRFLSRVFHGSVKSMANHLMNLDDLKLKDIQELMQMLEEKEQTLRRKKP